MFPTVKRNGFESISAKEAGALLRQGKGRPGMRVEGMLAFHEDATRLRLPPQLAVEALDLSRCRAIDELPAGLECFELNLSGTRIRRLPADVTVTSILNLSGCDELLALPEGLTVGTLMLRGCHLLRALPEHLDVWFLDMTGCWSFARWPKQARIRSGRLTLRGCTALASLPDYFGPLAALNVRDCPNLRHLPDGLKIAGWIDIAQSGLAETPTFPASLRGVQMRWQGIRVEERIVLHPESITTTEILQERNAERRRVLLDRFGTARFLKETKAELLDQDQDSGGRRQLLRVAMPDDEPLVSLSCLCPSTGHQYFLRVPPAVTSCHQAAAWIAGFDDPDDYHPLQET
jgi:hypothetical protein